MSALARLYPGEHCACLFRDPLHVILAVPCEAHMRQMVLPMFPRLVGQPIVAEATLVNCISPQRQQEILDDEIDADQCPDCGEYATIDRHGDCHSDHCTQRRIP